LRKIPSIVLVGRPNVGKSTLFNRITGSRRAIVAPVPGTTRDALGKETLWRGVRFELFDTGGLYGASEDPLQELVVRQGQRAIATAARIVFVVDGREGLVPADEQIAAELRQSGRPIVVAINKIDDRRARDAALDFYRLGFEPVFEISAEHGQGVADLLDEAVKDLPAEAFAGTEETAPASSAGSPGDEVRIAVVGRPNVGKSSLVNRLLRDERMLVSDVPGTTRDAVDSLLTWHRRRIRIVDTAGMRRTGRVRRGGAVELVSVLAARRAIEDADVVALVLDANEPIADQDAAIGGQADRAGCGIVIIANKWDLVKSRGARFVETFDEEVRRRMKFLEYAPILHISALTGERSPRVLETIDTISAARRQRVPTPALNTFVAELTAAHPPVSTGHRNVRILYAAQIGIAPPSFVFFTNVATTFHFSYERFLINRLREQFGFAGTPIRFQVRRRTKRGRPR
jgi:GTP-binding protein